MEKDNCQEQMKQPYFQDWFTKHVIFQESIFCKRFLASFHLFCSAKTLFCLLNKMGQGFSCSTSAFWKADILEGIFTKKSHVFCNMFALRCVCAFSDIKITAAKVTHFTDNFPKNHYCFKNSWYKVTYFT